MATAFRLRPSGRSSPRTPDLLDVCGSSSGSSGLDSRGTASELSAGGSPHSSAPPARRPRQSAMHTLQLALLPAAILFLATTSLQHRHQQRSQIAEELLHASAAASAHGARQLGDTPGVAAGRACAEALDVPQVAMLFLVKGPMRHEALWRKWFERAAGLLPAQAVSNSLCASEEGIPDAPAACRSLVETPSTPSINGSGSSSSESKEVPGDSGSGSSSSSGGVWGRWLYEQWRPSGQRSPGVLDKQHLFDVHVHPHPTFTGYPPGSLMFGRELPDSNRIATEWGSYTLVDAAEALLAAALRNPRNQKFFLLSESDLPLYSPHVTYLQLMSEHRSRVNACNTTAGWDLDFYRWVDRMETPFLTRSLWRKSSQWFVLNRAHAELVLADRRVARVLREQCRTTYEADRGEDRVCYPDEHYIPTLLAVHGLDNETDCQGRLMDVDWSRVSNTSPHPWEYRPGEMSDQLFAALRRPGRTGCGAAHAALAAAPDAFVQQEEFFRAAATATATASTVPELEHLAQGACRELLLHQQERPHYAGIGPECPLVARKFGDETVKPALMALAPCDSTALILNEGRCPGETERQRYWRQLWWQLAPWLVACSALLVAAPLLNALIPLRTLPGLLARASSFRNGRLSAPMLDV